MTILSFRSVDDFLCRFDGRDSLENGLGYVYACEYGKGIKIGSTRFPKKRIKQLESYARIYGNKKIGMVMITPIQFRFYTDFERFLHYVYRGSRKSEHGEIFSLALMEIEPVFVMEFFSFLRFIESDKLITTTGWNVMHKYINYVRSGNV